MSVSQHQASLRACGSQHCVTCADEGVEMTVVAVDDARGLALCAGAAGQRASVETALVEGVAVGDRLLVHAGTAIAALGRDEPGAPPSPAPTGAGDPTSPAPAGTGDPTSPAPAEAVAR
jgi:hydrogenase maturation factor